LLCVNGKDLAQLLLLWLLWRQLSLVAFGCFIVLLFLFFEGGSLLAFEPFLTRLKIPLRKKAHYNYISHTF
jgi:hypothetical protein